MTAAGGTCWRELLDRVRAGDRQAGDELYASVRRVLTPFLLGRLGPDSFEDSLHDIFIRFLEYARGGRIRKPEASVAVLLLAARNRLADEREAERRYPFAEMPAALRDESPSIERKVIAIDQARKALAAMSPGERQSCLEPGGKDVASRSLGIGHTTVWKRRVSGRGKGAAAIGYRMAA